MADVAAVFHWPLSDLREMEVDELLVWHRRASERAKAMATLYGVRRTRLRGV